MTIALTIVGFAVLGIIGVKKAPATAFGLLTLYEIVSEQVSVAFLDRYEVYITESATISFHTGAFWRFGFFNVVIVLASFAAAFALHRITATHRTEPKIMQPDAGLVATVLLTGIMGLQILNLALSGSWAIPGGAANRWNFWTDYAALPVLRGLFGILMVFVPFVAGTIFATRGGGQAQARLGILILAAYAFYLTATGQRFHGFLVPATILYGVFIARRRPGDVRVVPVTAVLSGAALLGILLSYSLIEFQDRGISALAGSPMLGVAYRILVLQGHAYWNADLLYISEGLRGTLPDLLDGMAFLMREIGAAGTVEDFSRGGVNFAVALPASLLLAVGFWGTAALCAVYGVALGAVFWWAHEAVHRGAVLALFPISYIWLWVNSMYTKASFEPVLGNALFPVFAIGGVILMYTAPGRTHSPLASATQGQQNLDWSGHD